MKKNIITEQKILVYLYGLGLAFFLYFNLLVSFGEQQFALLAQSFHRGQLYLGPASVSLDASYYNGFAYWPQGVFPAVALVPFVSVFQGGIHQGHIQFFLNVLNVLLLYKIALKITKDQKTSLWLSFAYIFSTVYLVVGLIPWSWWYAQVVASSAILLLVYEYFHKRRYLLMGIYIACGMATRIDLLFAIIFPACMVLLAQKNIREKFISIVMLLIPVFLGLALIALYNFSRFGSVFEFGYTYHIAAIGSAQTLLETYGVWNLIYYPSNFYYLFLKGIDSVTIPGAAYLTPPFILADPWGMSIFLTSPVLLWCLKTRRKEAVVKMAAITSLFILLFILGYFGIGARQYGYRYALDFQPFLFVILCFAFQKGMSKRVKAVIVVSFFFNLLFFPTIFLSEVN